MLTRTELEGDALPPEDMKALVDRISHAELRGVVDQKGITRRPDELLYEIEVVDVDEHYVARFREGALPENVRRLVEWVDARPERSYSIEP